MHKGKKQQLFKKNIDKNSKLHYCENIKYKTVLQNTLTQYSDGGNK